MEEKVSQEEASKPAVGRNEPCPCGSRKKFKRCCGKAAAPKLGAAPPPNANSIADRIPPELQKSMGGFDPSQMDPNWMAQITQMMQRLPRGQMIRLQSLVQKAMAGQDVSREAEVLQKSLPPQFQELMSAAPIPGMGGEAQSEGSPEPESAPKPPESTEMSVEEAKRIIQEAAGSGKISKEKAEELVANTTKTEDNEGIDQPEKSGISKFWSRVRGKS